MTPLEAKLADILATVLDVPLASLGRDSSPATIEHWDSIAHLRLILAVEEAFGVMFDEAEIPELNSFGVIADTLAARSVTV